MVEYGVVLDFRKAKIIIVKFKNHHLAEKKEAMLSKRILAFPNECQWMFFQPGSSVEIETMEV